jgi:hypothetical protein
MNMDSPVVSRDFVAECNVWHEQMGADGGDPLRFPSYASVVEEFETVNRRRSSHCQWLLLPRIDPARRTYEFKSGRTRLLAKRFGRHFSFFGHKP